MPSQSTPETSPVSAIVSPEPDAPAPLTESPDLPMKAAKAFEQVEPLLASIAPSDLLPINIDIPRAATIVVGAVPHILKHEVDLAKLSGFDIANVHKLTTFALAAWYAHILDSPVISDSELQRLLEEARPLREDLLLTAELLARKGFFDIDRVKAIRAGQGNLDTANDLVALVALFSAAWPKVENQCPISLEQVERAAELGPQILLALGARKQPVVDSADSSDAPSLRRARAFTLLVRTYDQCRRGVHYLRWNEGDADSIAPSLYSNRYPRKPTARSSEQASPEPASPEPVSPAAPAPAVN